MVEKFQTSFIPKKVDEVGGTTQRRKSPVSILMLGGIIVFLVAMLAAGGVFFYQQLLERSITSKKEALARAQEAFEPSLIRELVRLDNRIVASKQLIDQHRAPSSVFELLESITLERVRFLNFNFTETDQVEDELLLELMGEASTFDAVALQSDEFAESPYIQNPIFSNLAVTEGGDVTFSVSAIIDPELLVYEPPSISEPGPADEENMDGGEGEVEEAPEPSEPVEQ